MRELKGKAKDLDDFDFKELREQDSFYTKDLQGKAKEAYYAKVISESEIAAQKSLQEQLKTKDLYRDYVPVELLSVYFKLIEKIAKDTYIKIHSIMPEAIAYAKQNDAEGLERFIQNEIKNVFEVNITETKKEIKSEGYKLNE